MANAPLTDQQKQEALNALALHGNQTAAAQALGMSRTTFQHRVAEAQRTQPNTPTRLPDHAARLHIGIESGCVIVFNDAHYYPGEASTAHRAMIEAIREFRPRGVVANGDIFDGAGISRHPRIGWDRKPSVKEELDVVTQRLGEIEAACAGYAWKVWTLGNHDARFESFLAANAGPYQGVAGFALKEHFPAWQMAWRLDINPGLESMTIVKHRWKGGCHAVHTNARDAGCNMVTGHLHAQSVARWTDARGTRYGVDPGCLAEVRGEHATDYLEDGLTQWRSGFAILTFRHGRLLTPEVVSVVAPGVVEFRGKEWRV